MTQPVQNNAIYDAVELLHQPGAIFLRCNPLPVQPVGIQK